jgi:hypothetical protein
MTSHNEEPEKAKTRKGNQIMKKPNIQRLALAFAPIAVMLLAGAQANAQYNQVIAGLREPLGTALTNQGNLVVSETGTAALHSGRISIVDPSGNRRTLLDGLPSAINDVNEPSGPAGVVMRGRNLYVAIGTGDVGWPGPLPGTTIPNPNPISSPICSSILAIQFSAMTEKTTTGFTLTPAHQQALANGQTVTLSSGGGDRITIQMIADFRNYVPFPLRSSRTTFSAPILSIWLQSRIRFTSRTEAETGSGRLIF